MRTAHSDRPFPLTKIARILLPPGSVDVELTDGEVVSTPDADFVSIRFNGDRPTDAIRLPEAVGSTSRKFDLLGRPVSAPSGVYIEVKPDGKAVKKLRK